METSRIIASGALLFNEHNKFLLVQPSYKPDWEIPGGIVEKNESPLDACEREILEEIGLTLKVNSLLSVVYTPKENQHSDKIQFIFDGGILSESEIAKMKPDGKEIISFKFVKMEEAKNLLGSRIIPRIKLALANRDINGNTFANFNDIL